MAIGDEFDPKKNGWSFDNWQEIPPLPPFSWDLYRRTYLAINPTQDLIEAPLDCAFYEIFKNCGGMSMLGLALYKYGGYMGFCGPASFYTGGSSGPDRTDLHEALNIMQGRQFIAPGIQNFLDVVKAGQLNDAEAAFARIQSGLGSGDYAMLSLSNGLFGDAAHTVIPYRVEEPTPGTKVMHVWDPDRPFNTFTEYYTGDHNKITFTSPTSWKYDQLYSDGVLYDGANDGWFFSIPISLELHKGPQPISVGFALTGLTLLFVSGVGAVTQIEDDTGRRFYRSARTHRRVSEIETDDERRLNGVGRWPWYGARKRGELPGELFFLQRSDGSPPLTVTVRGATYRLLHSQAGNLLEVETRSRATARDRFRVEDFTGDAQALEIHTTGEKRPFDIHQLRADNAAGDWRSIHIRNAHITKADLRVQTHRQLEAIEVSSLKEEKEFDVEFRQYRSKTLATHPAGSHRVPAGKAVRLAPRDWNSLKTTKIESSLETSLAASEQSLLQD